MKKTSKLKRALLSSLIAASVVSLGGVPELAFAQSSNANLRGSAPANTTITAAEINTGATRRTRADAQGNYSLIGLPPGTYKVTAGNALPQIVTLSVASTATLDLQNAPAQASGAPSETNATELQGVTVNASTLPEVKTPEIATTISQHMLQTLPQLSQNFLEFADVVPSVAVTVSGDGRTFIRGGAQRVGAVNVYVDGLGQKGYVLGGIAGQSNSSGNPFPELAIGQYKVLTSNYKAEYAQVSSVGIVAQTKSGTNEFHGKVFARYGSDRFRARTPAENFSHEKASSQTKEFGVALGGPIIKDKAHFFVTYAGKRLLQPIAIRADPRAFDGVPYLPAELSSQYGASNRPFNEDLYFGKIDVEPTSRDRIELSAKVRNESEIDGVGGTNAVSRGINTTNRDKRYVVKWDHSADAWFNELIFSHESTFRHPEPITHGAGSIYTYRLPNIDPTLIAVGPPAFDATQNKGFQGNVIKDTLTFNDLEWHGNHVVKMGVTYRDLSLTAQQAAEANPQFFYHVTAAGVLAYPNGINVPPGTGNPGIPLHAVPEGVSDIPYEAVFPKLNADGDLTPTVITKNKQYGAFIQDDWDVTDRLQLNLGVRYDYSELPAYTDFQVSPGVLAALNQPNPYIDSANPGSNEYEQYRGETYAQTLNRSYNLSDYLGNGHNRSNDKGQWAPRLGFSYDLNNDQEHVIHGGAGRSYTINPFDFLQVESTRAALPRITVYFNNPQNHCYQNQKPCTNFDPSYLTNLQALQGSVSGFQGAEVDLLNNHLKTPYSDQYSLGMSNKVGDWQTDLTIKRVLYNDGFAYSLGGRYPDGAVFNPDVQPNPKVHGQPLPDYGPLILGNNGVRSRNTQLLISAQKPFTKASGWGATFAYTHSDAKQNTGVFSRSAFDYGTVGDYPFVTGDAAPKHRIVMSGSYQGPWGIVMGAKLKLATTLPFIGVACYTPQSKNPTVFPNGSDCHQYSTHTRGGGKFLVGGKIWGTREVDFQATKHFKLTNSISAYARFDLINAFNFHNLVGVIVDQSGGPGHETARFDPNGPIKSVPRTIRFEVGANF